MLGCQQLKKTQMKGFNSKIPTCWGSLWLSFSDVSEHFSPVRFLKRHIQKSLVLSHCNSFDMLWHFVIYGFRNRSKTRVGYCLTKNFFNYLAKIVISNQVCSPYPLCFVFVLGPGHGQLGYWGFDGPIPMDAATRNASRGRNFRLPTRKNMFWVSVHQNRIFVVRTPWKQDLGDESMLKLRFSQE